MSVKNVKFMASSLAGTASAEIDPSGTLFGKISGELRTPAGAIRGSMLLTGTVDKPIAKAAPGR